MQILNGKVAAITGGGSGIGFAVAKAFLKEEMSISICGRDEKKLEAAKQELSGTRGEIHTMPVNVSKKESVDYWIQRVIDRFGRIDVLVNNAGVGQTSEIEKITEEQWNYQLDTNLKGAFYCIQAVLPHMKKQQEGYIINISSICGKSGVQNLAAYSASKSGLIALSDSLRLEVEQYNIKVAAICPSYVATPMVAKAPVPQKEMIQPDDISRIILMLLGLSDYAVIKEVVLTRKGE